MMDINSIKERLVALGFEVAEGQEALLQSIADTKEKEIVSYCHVEAIPEGFMDMAMDMVCGAYLKTLKDSGKDLGIDIDSAASAITEGDTKVELAYQKGMQTPEQRLDALIEGLMRGQGQMARWRRLAW